MTDTIFKATKRICIEHQNDAEFHGLLARAYLANGRLDRAIEDQRESAYHADQAMTRLFRLIGTE